MSGINRWGTPTWIFFHTFAERINKDFFEANRDQCLSIIKLSCGCLPCPHCTEHAKIFMNSVNGTTVRTKEALIDMLFTFHNLVNRRIGKEQYNRENLKIYRNYRMDATFINYLNGYSGKYGSIMSGIISTLGKRRVIAKSIQTWMRDNWSHFN